MPEETTAVTSRQAVDATAESDHDALTPPCLGCGLRNPVVRRSCLACGAPLGGQDEIAGPLPIDPPLLERHEETTRLDEAVTRFLATREGGLVVIAAERGLGATRLLRHVAERLLESNRVRILTTTVREADGPYAPITRLLWERFGITPTKGAQAARNEIAAEVHRLLMARSILPTEHTRRIIAAAGLCPDENGRWELSAERELPRLSESLARFLAADAETQPIAMLVDRLHVASEEGLTLFRHVVTQVAKAPLLAVVAGEPQRLQPLQHAARCVVAPQRLSPAACQALCHHLLPGLTTIPDELIAAVVTRSEGAPGKVREILHALIESRVIVVDEVPWRVDLEALDPNCPVSAGDLLEVRWTRLDPEARAVLSRAAIVGEVFWEGAVVAMTRIEKGIDNPFGDDVVATEVREALRRLVTAELIAPIEESELAQEREFVFAQPGLRDAVLREQDDTVRRRRHDVCAAWLELAAGPRAEDLSQAIAGHLEKAGLREAAGRAYLRAARAARASYRGPQAVMLFDKALACLPEGDAPARIDALHDKGVVLSLLGRVDEAAEAFTQMLTLAHRYGARNKMAAALGRLGRLARGRGELDQARLLLWRALELFQQAEDLRGVAAVQDDLGMVAYLAGDFETALAHSTAALEIRRGLEDPLGEALSTHNLGLVHLARGQPRQARAHFERALVLREKHGDVEGTALTRNALAVLAFDRGDVEQAESMWTEILEIAETLGDKRMIAYVSHNLGEVAARKGDVATAAQRLDAAERVANELGDRRVLTEVERVRGMLARQAGDRTRAQAHLERSLDLARALGVREAEALALRELGELCAMTIFDESGQMASQAEAYFNEALRILEELGAMRELARTRAIVGTYLLERGDVMNGRKLLTLAVPVLERLELAEAAQARASLTAAGGELLIPGSST